MSRNCEFCAGLADEPREWYDFHCLEREDGFATVVALGSLVPGHVLVVADEHLPSMAMLSIDRLRALDRVAARWSALLTEQWGGDMIVFEHGSRSGTERAGACIVHAHWQLVPLPTHSMVPSASFHELKSIEDFKQFADDREYLMLRYENAFYVSAANGHTPQYFRRAISRTLGRPDEWDYLAYPSKAIMEETIRMVTATATQARATTDRDG